MTQLERNVMRAGNCTNMHWHLTPMSLIHPLTKAWNRLAAVLSEPKRKPLLPSRKYGSRDCVLVIDASLSMDQKDWPPSRLDGARQSGISYVRELAEREPDSRVAVVSYSDEADLMCELTSARDWELLKAALDRIRTGCCTNISAGLNAAFKILRASRRVRQAVLLTDGLANTGPDPRPIAKRLRQYAIIECVGIGRQSEVDENLLREIASTDSNDRKRYRWIGNAKDLEQHYRKLAGRITRQ